MFFLGCLSLIIFLASQGEVFQNGHRRAQAEDGVSRVLTYLSIPVHGAESLMAELTAKRRLIAENQRLKAEVASLRDAEMRANALALKIAHYDTLLSADMTSEIPGKMIVARTVSEKNGPFVRSALINAGDEQGVEPGYAIITPDGLFGHVIRVGKRSSRVLKLTDLNSRVAVMSGRSFGRAILSGDNSNYPDLSYIASPEDWHEGDDVITSGDDGVLPRGLSVGIVRQNKEGALKVELYTHGRHVDWVMVVPYQRILRPEDDAATANPELDQLNDEAVKNSLENNAPSTAPQARDTSTELPEGTVLTPDTLPDALDGTP